MKHLLKAIVVCAIASFCVSAPAAEKAGKNAKRGPPIDYSKALKFGIPEKYRTDFEAFIRARRALLVPLADPNCPFQTGGVCAIEVPVFLWKHPTESTLYCGAAFPELIKLPGSGPGSSEKTIVWSLKPVALNPGDPVPPANEITFYDDKIGVILLKNDSSQMHNGARGDGTHGMGQPDTTKFLYQNKHKVKTAEAVYLPVVVRTESNGKVSVCGTPDPRILND
jgi:hypothetical protein